MPVVSASEPLLPVVSALLAVVTNACDMIEDSLTWAAFTVLVAMLLALRTSGRRDG